MAVLIAVAHIETVGALIVAVACETDWSNRDFVTELLRVNFVGDEIGHEGKRFDFAAPW
jgi:hypothetical protein